MARMHKTLSKMFVLLPALCACAAATQTFADFVKTEIPRWAKVVKDAGVKPQ